jgi:superfamily II DNA/RNA helicase
MTEFREGKTRLLLTTDILARGIDIPEVNLVVNYDLPWNPQRIEQRIGRCHRYGQKHDVVVINFLNERNEAVKMVKKLQKENDKLKGKK